METPEGAFVLEVNASPNWKGALQLGVNPAKVLVKKMAEKCKK